MMHDSVAARDRSKQGIYGIFDNDGCPTIESINMGSLQRIADAAEAMAKNHIALMTDLEWNKRRRADAEAERDQLKRQVAGLRGTISRMKRQAAERETR